MSKIYKIFIFPEGELRSSEVFDREVKALYTFTVIATDSQGSYAEAEVVVTVLDANDNEPVLDLSEYNYTIPEGSVPGKLSSRQLLLCVHGMLNFMMFSLTNI